MAERVSEGHEGRIAATRHNRAAGKALRAARLSLGPQGSKQAAFAATLGRELGMPFTATAVSGWENGKRSVPGAVLVAAAIVTGQSLDALLGEAEEPEVVRWAETLGLPRRLAILEQQLGLLSPGDEGVNSVGEHLGARFSHLEREMEENGKLLAAVLMALQRRKIPLDEEGDQRPGRQHGTA
jgi:transcriptional regulator with XRE-family HTH domain